MEELKKENELLLRLVRTQQSQISSKTRQNQLLFQQYDQLAAENKAQASEILAFKAENRELRRASLTPKDAPKYTYAVLNSPRTEKLMADLQQTQLQLTAATRHNETLTQQVEDLKSQLNQSALLQRAGSRQEALAKSSGRIEDLERDLVKKEKELKELTLIMYAKDASATEIILRQEEKNKEIDTLKRDISTLKLEKDQKHAELRSREEQAALQLIQMQNRIKQLAVEIASLEGQVSRLPVLEETLRMKQAEVADLQSVIACKSENLEELSLFTNEQSEQLQIALETIDSLRKVTEAAADAGGLLHKIESQIEQKQQALLRLEQCLRLTGEALQEKEHSSSLALDVIKQCQNEIGSYQLIRDNLLSEIELYNRQSTLCKQELANCQHQIEDLRVSYRQEATSYTHEIVRLKQEQSLLKGNIQLLRAGILSQRRDLELLERENEDVEKLLKRNHASLASSNRQLEAELIEKEQSIAAFMDVLDALQGELRAKDNQIDSLIASQAETTRNRQELSEQLVHREYQNELLKKQLANAKGQLEEARSCHLDVRNENQELKNAHSAIQLSLNALITENLSLKAEAEELERRVASSISSMTQKDERIRKLEQRVSEVSQVQEKVGVRQRWGDGAEKEQYIEMLNAVIESIKNQHEESITKLHTKNHIIAQLQRRLEEAESTYNAQINSLRNSIACQEAISYEQLSARFPKKQTQQRDLAQQELEELLDQIQALREDLRLKDLEVQELREREARDSEEDDQIISRISQTLQDNNSRPISNIKPAFDSPHLIQLPSEETPSRIDLENESLHDTIEEQNYTILELQDNLIRAEHAHNSEVIALRRNIAELSAQILQLKRTLYELNPKSMDLCAFVKDRPKRENAPSLNARQRPASPLTSTSAHSQQVGGRQGSKKTLPQPPSRSNPYIAMMTNQKGELRFPESGSWSIQELRDLIQ